ncbi:MULTISPECIES: hypothetical protein [unclassified Methylobacterium]|jgi:hypothetical protein|uniref:hypothetical protein n=1 Tax=unclassified Methylobacterium TaxID=2615210 RepID=UPI00036C5EB6|nr:MULTISPECIES: hypothetical protein [unclassified Methylobacterium]KQP42116.1 hypothetical protein ASF34_10440 [Methylobacterium sp. Leaf106]
MRQTVFRRSVTGWRRAWIGLVAVLAMASPALAEGLSSFGATRLSAIRVDVGPLLAEGGGAPAEALRDDLLGALNREFADRIGGAGPVLVVRIKSLSLRPYTGSEGGRSGFGGGSQSDYLDGEALIVGRRGEVLARHPQLSALPSSSGGAWYDPDSERRRVAAIAQHYAGWLRRAFPSN